MGIAEGSMPFKGQHLADPEEGSSSKCPKALMLTAWMFWGGTAWVHG